MSQQPQRSQDPRRSPRAARHRSSVLGPPPGIESGTGYTGAQSSPRGGYQYPRPPPRVPTPPTPSAAPFVPIAGPSSAPPSARNVRPDPNIFDPIMEEPSPPRSRRFRQRDATSSSTTPTVMFYPSTTTVSSLDSDPVEPMPFFRTDPQLRPPGSPRTVLASTQEESTEGMARTVSVASSGVLGVGTIEVDPDTSSEDEGSISTDSSYGQLMREVSTVRRGQARIVRNPSARRRSVVPEVRTTPSPPDTSPSQKKLPSSQPPPIAPPEPPSPNPPSMPPPPPPSARASRRPSRLGTTSPPPVQLRRLSPVGLQPRPASSVYSNPSTPGVPLLASTSQDPRFLSVQPSPSIFARRGSTPSPSGSVSSNGSSSNGSSGKVRPRPPPLNMAAVTESHGRGSLTSLPDLLDRATRLHEVLSTGRTASMMMNDMDLPPLPREDSRASNRENTSRAGTLGDIIESFPAPAGTPPRSSWPLNWPMNRPNFLRQSRNESPLRQTTLGRGIVSQRTMDTPSPNRGMFGFLFPKFDAGDRTPTSRLMGGPSDRKSRSRRCCGLPLRTCIILSVIIGIIIVVAVTVTPILILRNRNNAPGLTASQCQTILPCQNNGVSVFLQNPPRCACLCAGGFTGAQCQTLDSSCVSGGPNGTSIGSAIPPLIAVANSNFSNQFTLSSQRIVEQFAASNVSCTLQNSLVNLNGSTNADVVVRNGDAGIPFKVIRTEIWNTVTVTTTITLTFTTTIPFMVTSSSTWISFTTATSTTTTTSLSASSTATTATRTVPVVPTATGITPGNLVFGRCVILAVVQESGVSQAASIQQLLASAIGKGVAVVQDPNTGITIDLSAETVSGLNGN